MRRPYLTYVAGVVLPSALTVMAGVVLVREATQSLWATSDVAVARMVHEVLAEDADPKGAAQVAGATGYSIAVYVDGVRSIATDSILPPELPEDVLHQLSARPDGVRMRTVGGTLVHFAGGDGPEVSVLASSRRPHPAPVPLPQLLVMALLMLFATLAGWIQLAGQGADESARGRFSVILLSLVPALTAWGFLVQADRLVDDHAREVNSRNLYRALGVAAARGQIEHPDSIRAVTGLHATLVKGDSVVATTFRAPVPHLAALPSPPPSFTSAGRVFTPEGPSAYVALRVKGRGFLVVTAPEPREGFGTFRDHALALAGVLGAWLVILTVATALLGMRGTPARSAPVDQDRMRSAD